MTPHGTQRAPRPLRRALAAVLVSAFLAAGCGGKSAQPPAGQNPGGAQAQQNTQGSAQGGLPRNETLYKAGWQWGPPSSFNPLSPSAAWPVADGNRELLIYETLFAYSLITNKLEPILAEGYRWDDPLTVTITLRKEPRWQDGQPLTADDVVYTLELAKRQTLSYSTFWDYVAKVEKVGENQIKITLNKEKVNRMLVENYLSTIAILPKHIFGKWEQEGKNLLQEPNMNPVGSGPYKLKAASPEQIILERDDNYWGKAVFGTPAPKYIVHPILKSNDAYNLALQQGQVDWSQTFVPQVWRMWEEKKAPVKTWYNEPPYHVPASIPSLYINLHKKPLDNPKVRRALAYAINYEKIAEVAMSRYSRPAVASLIIPEGAPEARYFDPALVQQYGWQYNPQKAVEILEKELGAKKGADGIYVLPDGTRLGPFKVEVPYGWTDWMTAVEIVAQSAKAVGIEIKTEFPEYPVVAEHRNTGNFDLMMWTPASGYGPAQPWIRFRDVLDSRGVPKLGEVAFFNFNRYSNPAVAPLLDKAATAQDEQERAAAYRELNKIFLTDIPLIPLVYRPWEFYTVNESVWTGFPDSRNPAGPPQHTQAGIKVYYLIKPKQ